MQSLLGVLGHKTPPPRAGSMQIGGLVLRLTLPQQAILTGLTKQPKNSESCDNVSTYCVWSGHPSTLYRGMGCLTSAIPNFAAFSTVGAPMLLF